MNRSALTYGGPVERLQPVVWQQQSTHSGRDLHSSVEDAKKSKTQLSRLNMRGDASGSVLNTQMEESSKLNMLIEEYRRENDRCSKRINELQRKLNATSNRR